MNQLCPYAKALKCTNCIYSYHRECKKFIIARTKYLVSEITPFVYSKQKFSSPVVWSRDMNKAKSAALQYASKSNTKVRKYSLSQVLSLTLQNEFPECGVAYIEYSIKAAGDTDKVKSVLKSFVESMEMQGTYVSIYIASSIAMPLDYTKL